MAGASRVKQKPSRSIALLLPIVVVLILHIQMITQVPNAYCSSQTITTTTAASTTTKSPSTSRPEMSSKQSNGANKLNEIPTSPRSHSKSKATIDGEHIESVKSDNNNHNQKHPDQPVEALTKATQRKQQSAKQSQRQYSNANLNDATITGQHQSQMSCDYDKGPWNECNSDGIQQRTLRLINDSRDTKTNVTTKVKECEPIKLVRRDCKPAGCKYKRGNWSVGCTSGQRVRVDLLVAKLGNAANCKPERRVTKDCRRTCHYIKSAWSECSNGFRTRNLTLDEAGLQNDADSSEPAPVSTNGADLQAKVANARSASGSGSGNTPSSKAVVSLAPSGLHCAKQRQLRRPCIGIGTSGSTPSRQTLAAGNYRSLTASQRRRLKQQQLQTAKQHQQQQQIQQPQLGTTGPTSTTTTQQQQQQLNSAPSSRSKRLR